MRIRGAAEALKIHLDDIRSRRLSHAVERAARLTLPRFFDHLATQRVRDLRAVTEEHVFSFAASLKAATSKYGGLLAPASQAAMLSAVRRFFSCLEKRGRLLVNPARGLLVRAVRRLPPTLLTEAEAQRLMTTPLASTLLGRRDRAILELLYGTGIRLGECARLTTADIDLGRGILVVRNGKGRRDRVLPLAGNAAAAIGAYLQDVRPELLRDPRELALFLRRGGGRLGGLSIQILVRKHARAARLTKKVSPHLLRHACATHLLRGGADIRHVQELLGHRQLHTTAIYTKVEPRDLKWILQARHPRKRWRRVR